jgi:hypothetical protein
MGSKRKSNALSTKPEESAASDKALRESEQQATSQEIVPADLTRVFVGEVFDTISQRLHEQIWASSETLRQALEAHSGAKKKHQRRAKEKGSAHKRKRNPAKKRRPKNR